MPFNYLIEVAVPPETDTTTRGRILEKFAKRFLESQNFSITEQVRLAGMEVDLLAKENTTGENIFVECKAHRSTIASEVISKLLGNVHFKDYSSGWLISTYSLSKDAKGFLEEWNEKPSEERRRLRVYPPVALVKRVIGSGVICGPDDFEYDRASTNMSNEAYLLLTTEGEFWALPVIDSQTGVRSAAILLDAKTGRAVTSREVQDFVSATDTTLKLPWVSSDQAANQRATDSLHHELDSIVSIPMADHWADYRPARPSDFVGREGTRSEVFSFLDAVRKGETATRLIAIKSPSGWGKSSTILKIADSAKTRANRKKYFIFPVDSRAASTRRFPELALASGIRTAFEAGFISKQSNLQFGAASTLFSSPELEAAAEQLKAEERVICIFFDQFEELLYKAELVEIFEEMRRLCAVVEEAQENIVIGFSWKTDGVVPSEHGAYHMWHSLADRRKEFELPPFTEKEVGLALNRFSKELGHSLLAPLRRVLEDHCQGFPWLLKKLCVHILELSKSGTEQIEILNSSINIQDLFKKDLEQLSAAELSCIQEIAADSPAEFFRIEQKYGDSVISKLIEKRLVVRSGTKLAIYWDIFRDYVLTEKIPYIPVTYVPQANFSRYVTALKFLSKNARATYQELGRHLNLGDGATDNLVRDLINIGHVDANGKEHTIRRTFDDEASAIQKAFSFWRSHEVVRKLLAGNPAGKPFIQDEYFRIYNLANKRSTLGKKTIHIYAMRMLRWLIGLGLIYETGKAFILTDADKPAFDSFDAFASRARRPSDFFLGQSPPEKVVTAFAWICDNPTARRGDIENVCGRNTCYALLSLQLMLPDGTPLVRSPAGSARDAVRRQARRSPTVSVVAGLLDTKPGLKGVEVGNLLAKHFGMTWSTGSATRYGSAVKQWARWTQQVSGG